MRREKFEVGALGASLPQQTCRLPGWTAASKARRQARALSDEERKEVLAVLHEPRFVNQSPAEVYATLLDEGRYICSERTMYRVLAENKEVRERRDQLVHPWRPAPELLATKANELWSWDITKLLGPAKWTYFYLYVILDVFSRYVVGWMVAHKESAAVRGEYVRRCIERVATAWDTTPAAVEKTRAADRDDSIIAPKEEGNRKALGAVRRSRCAAVALPPWVGHSDCCTSRAVPVVRESRDRC